MIEIVRVSSGTNGVFGVLMMDGRPLCVTAEPPWKDNKSNMSCIPDGSYKCVQHNGTKYKNVWALLGVKNRESILFHWGNFPLKDTEGCILLGASFSMNGTPCINDSMRTIIKLRTILPKKFDLVISGLNRL